MNKLTIPTLLLGIVMVAGVFAVMPVDEASTVHTQLQETSTNYVTVLNVPAVNDNDDFIITCPAGNDGCRILEIYLNDNDGVNTIDPGPVTVDIDGLGAGEAAFQTAADSGAATGGGTTEIIALTNVANTAIPATGVMRIEITPGGNTILYTLTVIAETEANTTIVVAEIGDLA